jgi:outer membrane immunogenic protein
MNKKVLGAVMFAMLMSGAAHAADIARPVYKAAPMVAPPFSWTGFYIGGHVGALRGQGRFDSVVGQPVFPAFGFLGPLFPIIIPSRLGTLPAVSASETGFVGGGQLGYNWQIGSNFLLGFEGDASWTRVRASGTFSPVDPSGLVTLSGTYTTEIDWTASLRARAGVTWDRLLVYATGGAALANWKAGSTFTLVNPTPGIFAPIPASGTTAASSTFTDLGWTIGGGFEWAFADNWSVAGEYRHSRFGSHTITLANTDPSGIILTTPLTTNVRLTTDQATLRLNYRFGR